MKAIKFIVILTFIVFLSSCGNKDEKVSTENQTSTTNVSPNNETGTNSRTGYKWWIGQYLFEESAKNVTGAGAQTWNYILEVKELNATTLIATIQIDGFQTMTRIEAKVNATSMDIEFIFDKYGKDNMFEVFKPGDRLFALMRNTQDVVMTNWDKLKPNVESNQESGKVRFKKIAS